MNGQLTFLITNKKALDFVVIKKNLIEFLTFPQKSSNPCTQFINVMLA